MYLLIGEGSALLLDTGATADAVAFPLYETVNALVGEKHLLVVHSHGHRDHIAADPQFDNREGVTLVTAGGSGYLETLGMIELARWRRAGRSWRSRASSDSRSWSSGGINRDI